MNKKQIELKRRALEKHIKTTYSPVPKYIDVWYEEDDQTLRSIVKFNKKDPESYLSIWDRNDLENISEITLTDKTYQKIYKTTAAHRLYAAASEGE
jgi:hypothetical protein